MGTISRLHDRTLNTANALMHVLTWGLAAGISVCWGRIPETVPRHFGAGGRIDGYGDKSILIVFAVMSFFVYGMHWFTMYITPRMTDERQLFGAKAVGKAETQEQERGLLYVLRAIAWTDVMILACFWYCAACTALVRNLGGVWTEVFFASLLLPFTYYMYKWNKLRRQIIARNDKI